MDKKEYVFFSACKLKEIDTMTTKQRENKITEIENLLVKYGATLDRWGMYHIGERKFDTRKVNLKVYRGKTKVKSETMSQVDLESFENYLKRIS
jgi:hypothetical protein